jgi:uncharacterized protein YkwD
MTLAGAQPRAALAALAATAAFIAAPSSAHAQDGCANAAAAASVAPAAQVGAAVRCLINRTRSVRGLPALRASERLRLAAARHGADMVRRRYFEHVSPDGGSLTERIGRTGYLSGVDDYALGENIAWGTGPLSTPKSIFEAWMKSPGHRAVILNGSFREAGVGVVRGVPAAVEGAGATYVLNVGVADR